MNKQRITAAWRTTMAALPCAGAIALAACSPRGAAPEGAPPVLPAQASGVAGLAAAAPASAASAAVPLPSAAGPTLLDTLEGTWRQRCQPFLPGDGASDITYTISRDGHERLVLAGVARDYKNTQCAGAGSVIAKPSFVQRIVGPARAAGIAVLRLEDADAPSPAPAAARSIVGIDDAGHLRFGQANGARDGDGFPADVESPADAYIRQ